MRGTLVVSVLAWGVGKANTPTELSDILKMRDAFAIAGPVPSRGDRPPQGPETRVS
ncbi:MAG: hypothetical protein AB4352_28215 [Hormoscilla sp.]